MANLCVNARDAITGVGKISIELENIHIDEPFVPGTPIKITTGDYILLAVSDDGHGMNREVQNRLIEPFFTTRISKGTGLGLSTVTALSSRTRVHQCLQRTGQGTTSGFTCPGIWVKPNRQR